MRGELIFTKPEEDQLVVKIANSPAVMAAGRAALQAAIAGAIPLEHLRHFVSLDLLPQRQSLSVESSEVIGPVPQRSDRRGGGKRSSRRPAARH